MRADTGGPGRERPFVNHKAPTEYCANSPAAHRITPRRVIERFGLAARIAPNQITIQEATTTGFTMRGLVRIVITAHCCCPRQGAPDSACYGTYNRSYAGHGRPRRCSPQRSRNRAAKNGRSHPAPPTPPVHKTPDANFGSVASTITPPERGLAKQCIWLLNLARFLDAYQSLTPWIRAWSCLSCRRWMRCSRASAPARMRSACSRVIGRPAPGSAAPGRGCGAAGEGWF